MAFEMKIDILIISELNKIPNQQGLVVRTEYVRFI